MIHDPANAVAAASPSDTKLRGLLGAMSVFTMIMTVPQVLAIWVGQQAAGVSILSWSAYLASALLWLWFGIRKRDRNIYLPCLGWIALDGAVIAGAVGPDSDYWLHFPDYDHRRGLLLSFLPGSMTRILMPIVIYRR